MSPKKTLLVLVSDRISDILRKGEYPPRYYNPGDLFDEVHLVLTNDDHPDPAQTQYTVGRAKLTLHNLTPPPFVRTLGWQPALLAPWVQPAIQLVQALQPTIIRTHANYFNGYLGAQIKQQLGIPLVVSLHINPDEAHRWSTPWRSQGLKRLVYERRLIFEEAALRTADWVLPVYEPARIYAERHGAKQVRICYNMLNTACLQKKEDYNLHTPVRILNVNRQFSDKNPDNLIRAVARLENVELTLVGDGPYHEHLREVAQTCSVTDRVIFHRAIPNSQLCSMLPDFDIFAIHSNYLEIGKSVLEALLIGLPIVINQHPRKPVAELQGDWVRLVDNTVEGYEQALRYLLTDHTEREALGHRAYAHAQERYHPAVTEQTFVDIYRSLLDRCS